VFKSSRPASQQAYFKRA